MPYIMEVIIQGVGTEVLYFMVCVAALFSVLTFVWWYTRQSNEYADVPDAVYEELRRQIDLPNLVSRYHGRCTICLSDIILQVETTCGHGFCGRCMRLYLNHMRYLLRQPECPLCRQKISMLLPYFTRPEQVADNNSAIGMERRLVIDMIAEYNNIYSGHPRSVMSYVRGLPILLRHLFQDFFAVHGLRLVFRLRIVFCLFTALVYVLAPFDLVPEALYGVFGIVDDIFILLFLVVYMSEMYRNVVANRQYE